MSGMAYCTDCGTNFFPAIEAETGFGSRCIICGSGRWVYTDGTVRVDTKAITDAEQKEALAILAERRKDK